MKILIIVIFSITFLDFAFPFQVNPHFSTVIKDTNGKILHAFLNNNDKWRIQTETNEITENLNKAIIFKEDKWFYWHFGVNPFAVFRAIANNVISQKRTSGASTITMQVARLLQPKKRNYFNKTIEILRAIQLEIHFSKTEILQMYISLLPYGSNIEGLKSASLLYFQKSPEVLSLAEITTLVIIPNRPSSLKIGTNNAFIEKERNKWLDIFKKNKLFDPATINDAITEKLNVQRHDAPKLAPHLSIKLNKENPPNKNVIETTIDHHIQQQIERITKNYINRLHTTNIHNAAIMVINNQSHEVKAYIGSSDFSDPYFAGQVDGIQAIRSPGSTLKPLVYALAIDKGILTPKTMINDVPINFGGFEPENFDKLFHGKVTAEYALANSLNIPAVKILKDISTPFLIEKLKKANFSTIQKNSKNLGLSIVLGGCGVSLEELTNLFSTFANKGKFIQANYLKGQSNFSQKVIPESLLSEESCFVINQILSQITRPDLPNNYDYTYRLPKIAWKTGTSFGKKDAWSIGYNAKYTVGVWIGNFSGMGVPELSGANTATPLLFDIFNTIDYNSTSAWFSKPANVMLRKICSHTGEIPSENCSEQILDYHIQGVSKMTICKHLKKVWVNNLQSISYCNSCKPDSGVFQKTYQNYPPELISYYENKHIMYEKIPHHNPLCTKILHENAPIIIFPTDGVTYFLDKKETQKLLLECQTQSDVKAVYWYMNNKLIAKASPTKGIFISPEAGIVSISCVDDKGRNTTISFEVKW